MLKLDWSISARSAVATARIRDDGGNSDILRLRVQRTLQTFDVYVYNAASRSLRLETGLPSLAAQLRAEQLVREALEQVE